MNESKVGYKKLKSELGRDEIDSLHRVYCESTVTITKLAEEYRTSVAVMRRLIMELFGPDGYVEANEQRARLRRKKKKWRSFSHKHANTKVFYKVLKLLLDSDKTFFEISKEVGCSRERVGQIARDCAENEISLNEERGKFMAKRHLHGKVIRGYPHLEESGNESG